MLTKPKISNNSPVLPIQGIGGFGIYEGGWTAGFIFVGLSKAVAISTGFGCHSIILSFSLLLGLCGILYLKLTISISFRNNEQG